jgi:hypothetical protein
MPTNFHPLPDLSIVAHFYHIVMQYPSYFVPYSPCSLQPPSLSMSALMVACLGSIVRLNMLYDFYNLPSLAQSFQFSPMSINAPLLMHCMEFT